MNDFSHIVSPSLNYESTAGAPTKYQFAQALGLQINALQRLTADLFQDLDSIKLGIGWWETFVELSAKQRILIGDYLYKATDSVCDNLIDAKIHFVEVSRFHGMLKDRYRDAVKIKNGEPQVDFPKYTKPSDDVDRYLMETNTAGLFRALGSALDCLAASLIGVLGLPHPIVRASMPEVIKCLQDAKGHSGHAHKNIPRELRKIFSPEGIVNIPAGWLSWVIGYRNMLVHRARRLQFFQLIPTPTGVTDRHGQPIIKTSPVQQLAKSPTCTDIEGFLKNGIDVLSEDALVSTGGVLKCVETLIHSASVELIQVWKWRRENPSEVPQPANQWIEGVLSPDDTFTGFAPGRLPVEADQIRSNKELISRMKSASLDGQRISFWKKE